MENLMTFRKAKDDFFANDPQSPLSADQKHSFHSLSYFPESSDFRFEVQIERTSNQNEVHIPTSTGEIEVYKRYGTFHFQLEGQEAKLTIFAAPSGYFLPFIDGLAGSETYPAGRYLEPQHLGKNRFLIDFNLAYNPYCAYNDFWSCPLTPPENRLSVPIGAGEKIFPH
ncbi:MAG: DUF1684 domain-containing protein [Anaerolineales bacterium]|nr:DUF1684 domain-containing protein [Anaerolineales bacterium]